MQRSYFNDLATMQLCLSDESTMQLLVNSYMFDECDADITIIILYLFIKISYFRRPMHRASFNTATFTLVRPSRGNV